MHSPIELIYFSIGWKFYVFGGLVGRFGRCSFSNISVTRSSFGSFGVSDISIIAEFQNRAGNVARRLGRWCREQSVELVDLAETAKIISPKEFMRSRISLIILFLKDTTLSISMVTGATFFKFRLQVVDFPFQIFHITRCFTEIG